MNTVIPKADRWWATYLKATAFLLPAIFVWLLSAIFVVPKIQQMCADVDGRPLPEFLRMMLFSTQHGFLIFGAVIAVLILLESRSDKWARYRRTVTGLGVFLFNSAVLSSLFIMLVTAITVAVELPRIGK